jgi:hypothetical protein
LSSSKRLAQGENDDTVPSGPRWLVSFRHALRTQERNERSSSTEAASNSKALAKKMMTAPSNSSSTRRPPTTQCRAEQKKVLRPVLEDTITRYGVHHADASLRHLLRPSRAPSVVLSIFLLSIVSLARPPGRRRQICWLARFLPSSMKEALEPFGKPK